MAALNELSLVSDAFRYIELNHNADLTASVDVGGQNALLTNKATDLQVLADYQNLLAQQLLNGHAVFSLASQQSVYISGVLIHDDLSALSNEGVEVGVLGNEVSLGVYFDDSANLLGSVSNSVYNALSSYTVSLLGSSGQTLFTQVLHSLFNITVRLGQCLLAVHHAAAGHLAQVLDILSSKSHFHFLLSDQVFRLFYQLHFCKKRPG